MCERRASSRAGDPLSIRVRGLGSGVLRATLAVQSSPDILFNFFRESSFNILSFCLRAYTLFLIKTGSVLEGTIVDTKLFCCSPFSPPSHFCPVVYLRLLRLGPLWGVPGPVVVSFLSSSPLRESPGL